MAVKLWSNLTAYGQRMRQRKDPAAQALAEQLAEMMRANCPVLTGSLQASIGLHQQGIGRWGVIVGNMEGGHLGGGYRPGIGGPHKVGDPVDYALAVEFGGPHNSAKPFIYPALEMMRMRIRTEPPPAFVAGLE